MERKVALLPCLFLFHWMEAQPIPIFHWTLDESSGPTAQEWNNLSNGVLQNGAQWAPTGGHHSGACRFDGVDDRIILGACDITTGGPGLSLSVWVKPDFVTAMERTIIAKTVGPQAQDHIWSIAFVQASALRFRLRAGASTLELSTAPSSVFSGTWYHIVASYDGAAMRIYLNGSLMAETAATGTMGYHPQAPASLGAQSTGAAPFSGWIDDVRIYDQGLTQSEVIDVLLGTELTTSIHEAAPGMRADGRFTLPNGEWHQLQLLDASGRTVETQRLSGTTREFDLNHVPTGYYLVCLLGDQRRGAWPVVVP